MKKSIFAIALSLMVVSGLAWSHEGHDAEHGAGGKEMTVKGELVDMACFMAHEGKGKKHGDCGKMCVQGGSPLGILTGDGAVYLLVEDHSSAKAKKPYSDAKKLVAETVTIKGDMYQRGGVQALVVESVTKE
jgi:hypothetical protein